MMKSVAFEHDPMQTKWLRTCLRLSSSENFKYAWLDLASLIAPFVIDSAAIRPATNDPIRWPRRAAARRSKLICAGDKLSRTPRPAPPSKATLCCCRRNRDLRRSASRYSVPCGQLSFVSDLARQFREIGIPADRIITEEFEFR
jgi:hypothetical protein